MSEEQNAVQKLYAEPKAKGFVNHLIGSYLPIYKASKVWNFKSGQKHKCNICGRALLDIQEAFTNLSKNDEKLKEEFLPFLQKQVNGEEIKLEEHPFYKYVTKGKAQAWTGEKTDTLLCIQCITDLLDLVQTGLLTDDKNISWRVNNLRRKEVFDVFKESPVLDKEDKEKVEKIEKRVERSPEKKITTFGDLKVLQDLKAKMEGEDGKE
jgi:hypothetical protein